MEKPAARSGLLCCCLLTYSVSAHGFTTIVAVPMIAAPVSVLPRQVAVLGTPPVRARLMVSESFLLAHAGQQRSRPLTFAKSVSAMTRLFTLRFGVQARWGVDEMADVRNVGSAICFALLMGE